MTMRVPLLLALLLGAVAVASPIAQTAAGLVKGSKSYSPPKTIDGQPDLQGVWNFATVTPLERPAAFAGREFLTDEEVAELQKRAEIAATDEARSDDKVRDVGAAYNDFWWDRGTKVVATKRTSLVVEPADGRIPALTPEAQKREAERAERVRRQWGPEDFDLNDRCIVGFNSGPPIIPDAYNNNIQIFQSKNYVVIVNEMVHAARMVPLDGRPHVPSAVRQWTGDPRGHWEGNTLVVDTTNFNSQGRGLMGGFRGSGDEHMHLVERFTRVSADILLYEFMVDDPTTYVKPWRAEIPMIRSTDRIYEYACHEGNYALPNMLSAARAREKDDAARAQDRK
jgi:hypothetical protein